MCCVQEAGLALQCANADLFTEHCTNVNIGHTLHLKETCVEGGDGSAAVKKWRKAQETRSTHRHMAKYASDLHNRLSPLLAEGGPGERAPQWDSSMTRCLLDLN
eukprot:1161734-Pelagomonas_calceolata.AAC.10